jgi:hypothetical protein
MQYYKLDISNANSTETYNKISELLAWKPVRNDNDLNSKHSFRVWSYEVTSEDHEPDFEFVNVFLDRLIPEITELQKLGIEKENISIWLLYEYDQQCNMEFPPKTMKRLGDNGIVLCISCWQKGSKIIL